MKENRIILGNPEEGKSMLGMDGFDRALGGRLWWDPIGDLHCPSWAVEADGASDRAAVERLLRNGHAVVFRAGEGSMDDLKKQVAWLSRLLRRTGASGWFDEAHLVLKQGSPEQELLALERLHRHYDMALTFMSQDPQTLCKEAFRVGAPFVDLFDVALSDGWFKEYGLPVDALAAVRKAGKHHYVTISPQKTWSPPKTLGSARLARFAA